MSIEKKISLEFNIYAPDDLRKKWFVYYYLDGKRIKKYGKVNSFDNTDRRMEECQKLIELLRIELSLDVPLDSGGASLIKFLADNEFKWRRKTYISYRSKVTMLLRHTNGVFSKESLFSFFDNVRKNRNPTTFNSYMELFRRIFKEVGYAHLMPEMKKLKEHKVPARYFQPHQIKELRNYISENDGELWFLIELMYYCMIRPGELMQLEYQHIQYTDAKILIPGHISKNKKTQYVSVPDAFVDKLNETRELKGRIFPYSKSVMARRHKKILNKLGFPDEYKLYSWKHTGAVMAAKAGVPLKQLQIQLRHHSLDQTDQYLRQMGVTDLHDLNKFFPKI